MVGFIFFMIRKIACFRVCSNNLNSYYGVYLEYSTCSGINLDEYWNNIDNQRSFLEDISKQIGVNELNDWKHVKMKDIVNLGGRSFLKLYPSFYNAIQAIYPAEDWNILEFTNLPPNFYSSIENQRLCLNSVCKRLKLSSPTELSNISSQKLRNNGIIVF